jgi:hypothetical protein
MGSLTLGGSSTRIGAPSETCSARAPTILALSKRVSFGGPIRTLSDKQTLQFNLNYIIGGMPPGIPPGIPPPTPPGPPVGGFDFEGAITSSIFSSILAASVADLTI